MNIKPSEIERIIKDFQYKYIELQGSDGRKLAHYNPTPSKLNAKVKDIKELLNKQPDGLYYLNFKISPKGDVFQYIYNKGNVILQEAAPVMNVMQSPIQTLEKFQTLQEWKRQEQEISDLKQKIAMLEMEKSMTPLAEPEQPEKNAILGFAETVLPMFLPIVDKYMSMKDRELSIKEQSLKKPVIKQVIKKQPAAFRPVPSLTDSNMQAYLNYFNTLNDLQAEQELNYLQNNNPDVYEFINREYYDQTDEV